MDDIDIAYLREWVGRERVVEDELALFPAKGLAALLNRPRLPVAGDVLPIGWQWLYFLDIPGSRETGVDGHPERGGFMPPVPWRRRMWAGGKITVHRPLHLGGAASRRSMIRAVELKHGNSGALVFITVGHEIRQEQHLCLDEEQHIVCCAMPPGQVALPAGQVAPTDAQWSAPVQADPVLLFRFSALTYNAHRIHYDSDYARKEEYYPALLVHGPLLVVLLAESVALQIPERNIRQLAFRAQRPTFVDTPFTVNGKLEGEQARLWTATHEGFAGMTATASLASADGQERIG
ncbi:MAG: acyl-CoA dehydrogenase [Parahaliea sp.]